MDYETFQKSVRNELFGDILPFWIEHALDQRNGGFIGRMTNDLVPEAEAPKGVILNARILWTYAAAHRFTPSEEYSAMADRAYRYLMKYFYDREEGGMFWLLDYQGNPVEEKKKVYGQAFTVYALAEYFAATGNKEALNETIGLFNLMEMHCYDRKNGGYLEATLRDWSPTEDLRLSDVDMNEAKSMNAHLHILEAYTNLYRVWQQKPLKQRLGELIRYFTDHIIDPETSHLILFFNEQWEPQSEKVSFGHDIETSWLLCEAAEALGDEALLEEIRQLALRMAETTLREGLDGDGGLNYERFEDGTVDGGKQWWPQAEAVVGFLNAYQLSGEEKFYQAAVNTWRFIDEHLIDHTNGEWFHQLRADGSVDQETHKISEWKGPYHTARTCIEAYRRLDKLKEPETAPVPGE